jgi:hypothetical protein
MSCCTCRAVHYARVLARKGACGVEDSPLDVFFCLQVELTQDERDDIKEKIGGALREFFSSAVSPADF